MITPYFLKKLLFFYAGIGSVLSINCYANLGIRIGIMKEEMVACWNLSTKDCDIPFILPFLVN